MTAKPTSRAFKGGGGLTVLTSVLGRMLLDFKIRKHNLEVSVPLILCTYMFYEYTNGMLHKFYYNSYYYFLDRFLLFSPVTVFTLFIHSKKSYLKFQ